MAADLLHGIKAEASQIQPTDKAAIDKPGGKAAN
jgi:hypothetical protein